MARLQATSTAKSRSGADEEVRLQVAVMQVPRITKITLNMGVSEAVADKKVMDNAVAT
jgi:large subunit ribosomal protein L5